MTRSYRSVSPKKHRVYSVGDVMSLYNVHRNTVSNWVKGGLRPSMCEGPQIFRGSELARFHAIQAVRRKSDLSWGEFYCFGCKAGVRPYLEEISLETGVARSSWAHCSNCSKMLSKLLHATEWDALKKAQDHNTPPDFRDEEKVPLPDRIVKIQRNYSRFSPTVNDRVIFEWLDFAARLDEKTIDAHLVAIREFEYSRENRGFDTLGKADVAAYRDTVFQRVEAGEISRSTAAHRVSHVKSFLVWLMKQDGYRRLSPMLPDYCDLPKRIRQSGLQDGVKDYPSLEQATEMLAQMSKATVQDRRARAIFATACLTGFRAGALITLRRKHIDLDARTAVQDGVTMRAKNGKSYRAYFFPRLDLFEAELIDWIRFLEGRGLQPDDALFPALGDIDDEALGNAEGTVPIAPHGW